MSLTDHHLEPEWSDMPQELPAVYDLELRLRIRPEDLDETWGVATEAEQRLVAAVEKAGFTIEGGPDWRDT